ncbi:MAG: uroporphyrinogen decarboxylase family protein [Bryobacterales bacterium]|nr:uroporphyrinogen decarboxylase family protein [Bryobacterales bacterium]
MTPHQRVLTTLAHRAPDRVPIDFGGTMVTGIHVSVVAALRDFYGLEKRPVKALDPGQMLGLVEDDLKTAMGIDVEGVFRRATRFGFPLDDWKPFRMYDGLEILVPGQFNYTLDDNGDTLMHPQGDVSAPPSARMPKDGYFFDAIIRQDPIDEDRLNPQDNLEEFGPASEAELQHLAESARAARATGRAVIASFGGTSFGDIALIPAPALKHPKGIRDITEWYMATRARRGYVHQVFEKQCEIALANFARIHAVVGGWIDVVFVCGTDFGTQKSSFCSVESFDELWRPYYKAINDWIHRNTNWKTLKHSCGSVAKFYPSFIEAGFDIINPVQCSAAGMDPEVLKRAFGDRLVFWGGGVDTQKTLPFGKPGEVRQEVLRRLEVFSANGGYVFNAVHNIQARTPVANIVAMLEAVKEFHGRPRAGVHSD